MTMKLTWFTIQERSVENTSHLIIYINPTFDVRYTFQVNPFNLFNAFNEVCSWKTSNILVIIYFSLLNYPQYMLLINGVTDGI